MKLLALLTLFFAFNANAQYGGGHGNGMYKVQRQIQCASNNMGHSQCFTGLERTQQVYMANQLSKSACIQGQSFQVSGDKIDVWNGCRAVFVARGLTSYPQPSDQVLEQPSHFVSREVLCESQNYKTTTCMIPLRKVREVFLAQQHSGSACIRDQSFFVTERYIQVSRGCRATFIVRGIE